MADSLDEEELRRLRARAYGPAADIHDDPAALQRLRELESPVPVPPPPAAPAGSDAADDPPASAAPDPAPLKTSGPDDHEDRVEVHPARRPWLVPAIWAASVAVAALVAATAALAIAPPAPPFDTGAAEQVVALPPDPDFAWPEMFGGRQYGAQGFEDHLGLTPIVVDESWMGRGGEDGCLMLIHTDALNDDNPAYSPWFTGCGAGPIPSTVAVEVDGTFPDPFATAYDGRTVQFVHDDDLIRVYVYDAE
ncbi:hypothetical protein [Microbacterium xanthum]|uniref:hypothetical protein n=1 Tax=Microbacterium xanthum TaxID=3079794 RepID=UPI002AD35E98|nr:MULTISPECIES: hypothetical protein [unclassified Microbacterium]MDZ8171485.1 hypothetical protein [Microbacterium sp. KSW-48]MDZ8200475.1 hypothetical protein [Microbacterium sp. SSW1-59]